MKFMLILKSSKDSEAGKMPSEESIAAMVKYNPELAKAGILLDAAGLYPSSKGARVRFSADGTKTVLDGPFAESEELVGGYWIIQMKSREEAIEWAKRSPCFVSSVNLTPEVGARLPKGDEFGFFLFGGSDIVMLFQNKRS
jgi:hypothetical protein